MTQQYYRILKGKEDQDNLLTWWGTLDDNRGDRARLRRAERPDDVLLTEPFFRFLHNMPKEWSNPERLISSAMIAAAASHVKEQHGGETFATQLALPKRGGKKARVSELRFQQLQKSRDPEEFFRRLLRTIRLAECKVNIISLAESILHWMEEYRFGANREPQKRLSVRWGTEYYVQALKNNP